METSPNHPPLIIVLVRDLMFSSRIRGMAGQLGIPITLIADPARLSGLAGKRLIVDLNLNGAIPAAAAWRGASAGDVVGFVSHVDAPTIQQARSAGLDQILPRSQFVAQLPNLLRINADDAPPTTDAVAG